MVAKRKKNQKQRVLCLECDNLFILEKVGKKVKDTICPDCIRKQELDEQWKREKYGM